MGNTTMTHGSLFSGIGGFDLGFERAGITTIWQVEIDPYCRKVLEKNFPHAKRYDDIHDVVRWHHLDWVDVISGGFPCQDISQAGKRVGIDGERSGLWAEMWRVIRAMAPRFVVVENVAALLGRGMERVLGDLAAGGYDAEWDVLPACAFGAPHIRERVFIVAYPRCGECKTSGNGHDIRGAEASSASSQRTPYVAYASRGRRQQLSTPHDNNWQESSRDHAGGCDSDVAYPALRGQPMCGSASGSSGYAAQRGQDVADTPKPGSLRSTYAGLHRESAQEGSWMQQSERCSQDVADTSSSGLPQSKQEREYDRSITQCDWWAVEPDVGRVAHGVPHRVDRLRGLGNAVVPQIAEWIARRIKIEDTKP